MDAQAKKVALRAINYGLYVLTAIDGVDEAANRLWYTSSEPTPTERHLFSISLDGTGKKQLTAANFTHSIAMSPNGSFYLDTYSSLTAPGRTTLHSGDGAELGVVENERDPDEPHHEPSDKTAAKPYCFTSWDRRGRFIPRSVAARVIFPLVSARARAMQSRSI